MITFKDDTVTCEISNCVYKQDIKNLPVDVNAKYEISFTKTNLLLTTQAPLTKLYLEITEGVAWINKLQIVFNDEHIQFFLGNLQTDKIRFLGAWSARALFLNRHMCTWTTTNYKNATQLSIKIYSTEFSYVMYVYQTPITTIQPYYTLVGSFNESTLAFLDRPFVNHARLGIRHPPFSYGVISVRYHKRNQDVCLVGNGVTFYYGSCFIPNEVTIGLNYCDNTTIYV